MALDEQRMAKERKQALDAERARRAECQETMASVERAAAAPERGRDQEWRAQVRTAMLELKEAFGEHVALTESRGGLLGEVAGETPRLIPRTKSLADEHSILVTDIDGVIEALARHDSGMPIEDLRGAISGLLNRLERHRQAGSDLLYESLEVDIGGGDD